MIGLLGGQRLAREDHFHGLGVGNLPFEPDHGAGTGHQPTLYLRKTERGPIIGNTDIGLLQHFTSATQARTVDRRDERFGQGVGE